MCIICGGNQSFDNMFDIEHMEKALKTLNDAERKVKMTEIKKVIKEIETDKDPERGWEYAHYILARNSFAKFL